MRAMKEDEEGSRATLRVFAIAAIALFGLAFSATPIAERIDAALLDAQWKVLRKFSPRPAPDDIIVVGVDEKTLRALNDPLPIWHEALAKALLRIAAAKPRAIGIAAPLPERSFESVRPGLDRALLTSLAAARQSAPLVAVLDIDARTREARPIHPPYLAVLNDERLGLGLLSRDVDGVTRRFSLTVPTEDGGYPTLAGRLCHALSKTCADGYIHYALGHVHRFVALNQVVESTDPQFIDRLFRDRIVMIGETQRHSDRVEVPINLAGWESDKRTSPAVVVHAQALRTALAGAAPVEAARPLTLVLVTLAALVWLMRRPSLALLAVVLAAGSAVVAATLLLRGGLHLPIGAALVTLVLAWAARAATEGLLRFRERERLRSTFAGRVNPATQRDLARGALAAGATAQPVEIACLAVRLRVRPDTGPAALAALERAHGVLSAAVLRHDGMLASLDASGALATFGAPRRLVNACAAAALAAREMSRGMERPGSGQGKEGPAALEVTIAAAFGPASTASLAAKGPLRYAVWGPAVDEALALEEEARRSGQRFTASEAFRARAGADLSDFQHLD